MNEETFEEIDKSGILKAHARTDKDHQPEAVGLSENEFCGYCEHPLAKDSKFCSKCGAKVPI